MLHSSLSYMLHANHLAHITKISIPTPSVPAGFLRQLMQCGLFDKLGRNTSKLLEGLAKVERRTRKVLVLIQLVSVLESGLSIYISLATKKQCKVRHI